MKRVILKGPDFCAVTEDGRLAEYIQEDASKQNGDILLGKIDRIMAGLDCAFVDIGRKRSGFLPLAENSQTAGYGRPRSGDRMILQIQKEEVGEKGAYLSRDLALAGQNVILMPMNRYIGVSKRIESQEMRERLKELGALVARDRFGLVMRNAAAEASAEKIQEEAEWLYGQWKAIEERAAAGGKIGTVLWHSGTAETLLNDYTGKGPTEVMEAAELSGDLRRQMAAAGNRKIALPGGGNIVIDRCEAMTVVDVNSGSADGKGGSREQTLLQTNLEACDEAAIQIRLRDITGIILIDFIDLDEETDRSLVLSKLTSAFQKDRIKTVIHGWTRLGLMEMTRKRR